MPGRASTGQQEPQGQEEPQGQVPQGQATQGQVPQGSELEPVEIEVEGVKFTFNPNDANEAKALAELKKGRLRHVDYTRKTEKVAELRRQLQLEREEQQRGIQSAAAGQGGPSGSMLPVVGGFRATSGVPNASAAGTPYALDPRAPGLPSLSDEEYVTGADMRGFLTALQQQNQALVQQVQQGFVQQQGELKAERDLAQLERDGRMPGFSRALVEETLELMDDVTRAQYDAIPDKAARYKLVYYDELLPVMAQQAKERRTLAQNPEQQGEQEPEGTPHVEQGRAGIEPPEIPPDLEKLPRNQQAEALGRIALERMVRLKK